MYTPIVDYYFRKELFRVVLPPAHTLTAAAEARTRFSTTYLNLDTKYMGFTISLQAQQEVLRTFKAQPQGPKP